MARPSRNDTMIKNLMKRRRDKYKEVKTEESKPKDPEDVKKLLEMWQKIKKE